MHTITDGIPILPADHPISITLNAACKSHSVVDFARLLSPGWDISELTEDYAEIRRPSAIGEEVLIIKTRHHQRLATTFDMVMQAYPWKNVLDSDVQEALDLLV